MTSKIHVVVDTNGLPVRLGLTAGEAHNNRLAFKLFVRSEIRISVAGRPELRCRLDQSLCRREGRLG
jgi:transposase